MKKVASFKKKDEKDCCEIELEIHHNFKDVVVLTRSNVKHRNELLPQ